MRKCSRVLVLVAACGPGSPDAGTAETSGETSATSTTGDPVVTSTGTAASDETTSPGTTADRTTSSSTGPPPCEDTIGGMTEVEPYPGQVPKCVDTDIDWKTEHVDCRIDCATNTQIHGEGEAAGLPPISLVTFGVAYGACGTGISLHRIHLGDPIAPALEIYTSIDCAVDPWLGAHPVKSTLPDQTTIEATLTIDSHAGDWQSEDPSDPPRLFGSFSGDLVGPFEAVHCAALDTFYDSCA